MNTPAYPNVNTSQSLYDWTQIIYGLHALSLVTGILGAATVIGPEDLPDSLREKPSSNASTAGGRRLADVEREHIARTLRAAALYPRHGRRHRGTADCDPLCGEPRIAAP